MLDPGPLELAEADIVVERVHLPHQSPAQALRDWRADNVTTIELETTFAKFQNHASRGLLHDFENFTDFCFPL